VKSDLCYGSELWHRTAPTGSSITSLMQFRHGSHAQKPLNGSCSAASQVGHTNLEHNSGTAVAVLQHAFVIWACHVFQGVSLTF
jgi:hypothetical protein